MNYFFILLLTFFLGNCFTIYMTVKHIVPANFKIAFALILIGLSAFMYSYVIYSRYFSENFSYVSLGFDKVPLYLATISQF